MRRGKYVPTRPQVVYATIRQEKRKPQVLRVKVSEEVRPAYTIICRKSK